MNDRDQIYIRVVDKIKNMSSNEVYQFIIKANPWMLENTMPNDIKELLRDMHALNLSEDWEKEDAQQLINRGSKLYKTYFFNTDEINEVNEDKE